MTTLRLHNQILKWGQELENKPSEAGLVLEQLQAKFAEIINKEIRSSSGIFYNNTEEDESNKQERLT